MSIEFNYPIWYSFLCVLVGVGYSFFLYRREKLLDEIKNAIVYTMAFFRFLVVTLLCFLLLEPLIETETEIIENPLLIIGYDNSESLLVNKDSAFYRNGFLQDIEKLENQLESKYELKTFSFGDQITDDVSHNYLAKQTDVSSFIDEINSRYYGRNIGAIILATDGIVNKGNNPIYSSKKIKHTPFYTIAMGDTTVRMDLSIHEIRNNRIAYKGNQFPVELILKGNKLKNEKINVTISKKSNVIFSKEISWTKGKEIESINVLLEATGSGKQRYEVTVSKLNDELTFENNEQEFYIDVLDSRQKILLLARAPHPDIAAMKIAWMKNSNYEINIELAENFKGNVSEYSMIVLHDLPSDIKYDKLVKQIVADQVPLLFIVGVKTNVNTLNSYNLGLNIQKATGTSNVVPSFNSFFTKFSIDEKLSQAIPKFPPLTIPFSSSYKVSPSADIFLFQKIGSTKTDYPLLVFNDKENVKYGFLLGEGIWRWKMADFQKNKSHDNFDLLISKITQYVSVKEDKSQFRVFCDNEYLENEEVVFTAELYNDSYELVNDPEVILSITNENGDVYPDKIFSQSGNGYRLDAGMMEVGEYSYVAQVNFGGRHFVEKGEFRIKELKTEYLNIVADHRMLYNLSDVTGGQMFYPDQLTKLSEAIFSKEDIVPVSFTERDVTDIIKWRWIFIIITSLLSIEWFLRKRNGAY